MTRAIALIGLPGAGKSTVGPLLAAALGQEFIDVDVVIVQEQGTPIADIFIEKGEPYFRALEEEATVRLLNEGGVVALGGGGPMNANIRDTLAEHDVVLLEVSISGATKRVGMDKGRPLLLGNVHNKLVKLVNDRMPTYHGCANIEVDTNDKDPEHVVEEILHALARERA